MTPEQTKSVAEKIHNLRGADPGPHADKHAALLNAEIQLDLMTEINGLQQVLHRSTDRIIQSNKETSDSSEKLSISLVRATWGLTIATIVLVLVTLLPFVWQQLTTH
jgi:hypothetical protein